LNRLSGAIAGLPGLQQPLPTIGHLQPKFSIIFVTRPRGGVSTLRDLRLKKIGRFEHCVLPQQNARSKASANKRLSAVFFFI
jgi:hypothetical protein